MALVIAEPSANPLSLSFAAANPHLRHPCRAPRGVSAVGEQTRQAEAECLQDISLFFI